MLLETPVLLAAGQHPDRDATMAREHIHTHAVRHAVWAEGQRGVNEQVPLRWAAACGLLLACILDRPRRSIRAVGRPLHRCATPLTTIPTPTRPLPLTWHSGIIRILRSPSATLPTTASYFRQQPRLLLPPRKVVESVPRIPELWWHKAYHARDGISHHHLWSEWEAELGQSLHSRTRLHYWLNAVAPCVSGELYRRWQGEAEIQHRLMAGGQHGLQLPALEPGLLIVQPHSDSIEGLSLAQAYFTIKSFLLQPIRVYSRLSYLSWRLWQCETFVVDNDRKAASTNNSPKTLPQNISSEFRIPDLPQLSGSVDSLADEEAVDFTSVSAPLEICRLRIRCQDSCTSSRSKRERHISSDDFEKMIVSIVKDKDPLSAPPPISPIVAPLKESLPSLSAFERPGSTTTETQSHKKSISDGSDASLEPAPMTPSRAIVVRGFSPSSIPVPRTIPSSVKCTASDMNTEPTSFPAPKPVQSKKQPTKFTLGGASFSSTEQDQSLDNRKPIIPIVKKPMFTIGGSSEEDGSLKSALAGSRPSSLLSPKKKQASFSTNVMTRTIEDEAAVDSDTDYIDESAIDDDDDSSDWEDSIEDSDKSSMDDKFFQRVDSKANLTSRRSLITLMLAQNDRARTLGNHTSQSTSAIPRWRMAPNGPSLSASSNDSDEAPLMMKGMRPPTLKPIHEISRSSAQPIVSHASHAQGQAALSPRTTRRNLLATELTKSLHRHLLWERQQKSSTANAVLKRRHTSHDVTNLKQYPVRSCMKTSEDVNASSWNQYFSKEASNGYHSKGW
ncbi:hypothetical protein AUP68_11346 [Ilyonectria robusta]